MISHAISSFAYSGTHNSGNGNNSNIGTGMSSSGSMIPETNQYNDHNLNVSLEALNAIFEDFMNINS